MASCFTNPNKKKLSAKDYTIKKRRSTIFCDLRKIAIDNIKNEKNIISGNNEACVDYRGIFLKYKNKSTQLDMLAAYKDIFKEELTEDVSGQLFTNHFCSPYDISKNNADISNNYYPTNIQLAYGDEGYGHVTTYFGALNNDIISTHTNNKYRNTYAEIMKVGDDTDIKNKKNGEFKNNKFKFRKPCVGKGIDPLAHTHSISVLKPSDWEPHVNSTIPSSSYTNLVLVGEPLLEIALAAVGEVM